MVCQIVFGIGASMIVAWFSRHREFRADAGSARLLGGPQPMINALARLGGISAAGLPQSMAAMGISDKPGFMELFSTHPPTGNRIAKVEDAITTVLPPKDQYVETTSEFDRVKTFLAKIESLRPADDPNRPIVSALTEDEQRAFLQPDAPAASQQLLDSR